jgi:hypothetical protein
MSKREKRENVWLNDEGTVNIKLHELFKFFVMWQILTVVYSYMYSSVRFDVPQGLDCQPKTDQNNAHQTISFVLLNPHQPFDLT